MASQLWYAKTASSKATFDASSMDAEGDFEIRFVIDGEDIRQLGSGKADVVLFKSDQSTKVNSAASRSGYWFVLARCAT